MVTATATRSRTGAENLERIRDILAHTQAEHRFLVGTVQAAVAAGDRGDSAALVWLREWLSGHVLDPPADVEPSRLISEAAFAMTAFALKAWTWRCLRCGVYGNEQSAEQAAEAHQQRWHSHEHTSQGKG